MAGDGRRTGKQGLTDAQDIHRGKWDVPARKAEEDQQCDGGNTSADERHSGIGMLGIREGVRGYHGDRR